MCNELDQALKQLAEEFAVSKEDVQTAAFCFQEHMKRGLQGKESSLKMLPSYLQGPGGGEKGVFLALDFGGSNARAAVIELQGNGVFREAHKVSRPLFDAASGRDYRAAETTAEELFDFLAGLIEETLREADFIKKEINGSNAVLPLGFTFSFFYRQKSLKEGILAEWNKEVKTSGVEGRDVARLLTAALNRRGLDGVVKSSAVLNDSTANYLTAAYQDPYVTAATILGTGHNTCYLESSAPGFAGPVIINTETGNFSAVPETGYDRVLDEESDNPGEQYLEKRVSAKYLGELFRLIMADFSRRKLFRGLNPLPGPANWNVPYSLSGKDMADLCFGPDLFLCCVAEAERRALPAIAGVLLKRSARLAAAGLLGVVRHIDPEGTQRQTVAVDGSLYAEMPGYARELSAALEEGLGPKAGLIKVNLSSGGSLVGAGIAAALAGEAERKGIMG